MPAGAREILRTLGAAGYEAYIVGGCVRDSLMGREPADWDITTSAGPYEVKALFSRTIDTGLQHGTVTVRMHGESYEVTTYRIDGAYEDHRHPAEVTYTKSLSEDLARRDFTINAMACDAQGGLVDLFGGREDLAAGVIRAVGDARKRFDEDALRMMRAVRFAAQFGFALEEETREAIRELAPTLAAVSAERIRDELEKLLVSPHPDRIRTMWELGLTEVFLPEFTAMMETPQNNPHHCYSVGEHTIAALTAAKSDRVVRLAALLHDAAKPLMHTTDAAGIDHFKGHPAKGAELSVKILRRLREDSRTIRQVENLIRWHDLRPESDPVSVRRMAARVGSDDLPLLLDLMEADVHGQSTYLQQEKLERLARIREEWERIEAAGEAVGLKDLAVTGSDLIRAGMSPGPAIGELLQRMLADVIDEPAHNTAAYLLGKYLGKEEMTDA